MHIKLPAAALGCVMLTSGALAAESVTVEATIPIEILAVDPAIATGGIPLQRTWSAPRIAMQPARAARGAVLEKNGDVLTLALLIPVQKSADGRARLDGPADRIAWCAPLRFMANALNCYQDLDSDGKFETTRLGLLGTDEALALSRLQEPKPIEPLAYRAANDAELPRFQVGYRACGATVDRPHSFDGELRFATVVRRAEGVQWPNSGRCDSIARLIETTPDGAKRFEMGRFKIDVRESTEQELSTRLVEGIAPGTLLAHVRTSWPLTDATERPAEAEAVTGNSSFLVALGKPAIATRAKAGDEIFSVEVRHGLSGTLEVDSEPRLKWDKIRLPAGTPVYGIPMRSSLTPLQDAEVVWCTPFQRPDGKQRAHCFAPYLGGTSLVEAYSTPYAVRGVDPRGRGRNPPVVARGHADFGAPLVLSVKVTGVDKKSVHIAWSLAPRGQWLPSEWGFLRARNQNSLMLIGELLLKIGPVDDGQTFAVTAVGEIDAGTGLDLPADAVRLLR